MTEICFEPGIGEQDVAEALRALSGRLSAVTPAVALGGRHAARAGQAVFASVAIMRLFGVYFAIAGPIRCPRATLRGVCGSGLTRRGDGGIIGQSEPTEDRVYSTRRLAGAHSRQP